VDRGPRHRQLQDVADGDLRERASLGGNDQGASVEHLVAGHGQDAGIGLTQRAQSGETLTIPRCGESADEGALPGGGGQ